MLEGTLQNTALAPEPPRPRVFIETYGCSFNQSDGEVMAGLLARAGYEIVPDPAAADAVIINSCTVKDRTVLDFQKRVTKLSTSHPAPSDSAALSSCSLPVPHSSHASHSSHQNSPAIILAGCVPRVPSQSRQLSTYSQIGPDTLADLPSVVARTLAGEVVHQTARQPDPDRLALPTRRRNPAVEILPISKGCLGACTFCQTVLARGRLYSYPEDHIIDRVTRAAAESVRFIWLTSQDCGAYGLDRGTNLPRLLRRLARIPGDIRIRIGMANPDLIKLYLDEFAAVLADHPDRFFQFVHIPVQSGSDRILDAMKRLYAADDFRRIVDAVRARSPRVTIATDIITGFPGETDDDHRATLDLLLETAIPVVNRSRFSPRPGTPAARMKPLPGAIVAHRSSELYETCRQIAAADLATWLGWTGPAWIEDHPRPNLAIARNYAYKPLLLESPNLTPGQQITVRTTNADRFHLKAEFR